ncbi:MAG: hypothetical protein AAGJ46_04970 [Planctomycetota bacterium]
MTLLGKALFSLLLVGGGFGLASVFGPPDLADKLADQLTPGKPVDPWGELRPAPADQPWATFAANEADRIGAPLASSQPGAWPDPNASRPIDSAYRDTAVRPAAAMGPANDAAWPPPARAPFAQQRSADPRAVAPAWGVTPSAETQPAKPAGWPAPRPGAPARETSAAVDSPAWRAAAYRRPAPPADAWEQAYRAESPAATLQPPQFASGAEGDLGRDHDTPWQTQPAFGQTSPSQPSLNGAPFAAQSDASQPEPTQPPPAAWQEWPSPSPAEGQFGLRRAEPFPPQAGSQPAAIEAARSAAPRVHIVADGDTLASLARRYLGDSSRAEELFARNRGVLDHPDLLPIGAEIVIEADRTTRQPTAADSAGLMQADPAPAGWQTPRARLMAPVASGYAGGPAP